MKNIVRNFIKNFLLVAKEHKFLLYTLLVVVLKCLIFQGFTIDKNASNFYLFAAFVWTFPRLKYYIAFGGIILSFAFILKGKPKLWFLFGINVFISALLLMDLWYYRGFSTMTSLHLLAQTSNLDNLSGSILSLIHVIDAVFVIDILFFLLALIKFKSVFISNVRSFKLFVVSALVCIAVIGWVPFKSNVLGISDSKAIFSMLDANISAYNLSPIGYHVLNAYAYFTEDTYKSLKDKELRQIKNWFSDKQENLPANKYQGLFKGKNLILVQLESFENFPINNKIEGQEITPNINKLLNNSLNFTNVHEQVNQGTTSDAELMLNTSVYPLREGSAFFRYPYNKYPSLPKLLEKNGYSTLSIHSDKGSYWNWMIAHSNIGFQQSLDSTAFEHDESIGMGLSDGSLLRQIIPEFKKMKKPFYSFVVTLSNHAPFDIHAKFRELKLSSELDKSTVGGYLQSVRYVDTQIGTFIERLNSEGLLKDTVVVLCGDHEGIHKYYQQEVESTKNLPEWMYENEKRVPFIVYSPELEKAEITLNGGQVDVMPTLSYLMGVDEKDFASSTVGRNLLNTQKDFVLLKNGKILGKLDSNTEKHALQGLEVSDNIVRSNYFEKYIGK